MSRTSPPSYARALGALADAVRDANALAELLEYAALLRGRPADPDGPPLEVCPGGARVLAVLGRRDRALADAERVWDGLHPTVREELSPPDELLEDAECVQDDAERPRPEATCSPAGQARVGAQSILA